ncbi:bidirectional sugar transporter SWEET3b-like [Aristolochia californica]|uniref:bidirectional sugar transporter SWEET3b-like n=1 Tax=Aristolochia californica TaxID=171875 RepID=UPI0035DFD895
MDLEALRFAVGVVGSGASFVLYAAPILTFRRVVQNRSAEGYSCAPYILALFNTLTYSLYGLPSVSIGWENVPLFAINGLGVFLEMSFIIIFFRYSSAQRRRVVFWMLIPVLAVFTIAAWVTLRAFHDHPRRKAIVGTMGIISTMFTYASPLIVVKQVLKTKSSEFMPFSLSLSTFLASSIWMTYGLLGRDYYVAAPNILGCPLGFAQLLIYFMYRKKTDDSIQEPLLLA